MPVAFVTGANRGIGLELVRQLLQQNYTVHATYRKSMGGLEGLDHPNVHCHRMDVRNVTEVNAALESISTPIDLLINNAGIADGRWSSVEEIDFETVSNLSLIHI